MVGGAEQARQRQREVVGPLYPLALGPHAHCASGIAPKNAVDILRNTRNIGRVTHYLGSLRHMTFLARELSVLAYANGFTLWHYRTSADDLLSPGYFDSAQELLREG